MKKMYGTRLCLLGSLLPLPKTVPHATEEGYGLREIQSGLYLIAAWCEHGLLKSMKTRLKRSTSLLKPDRLILFLR
jgi:hypothetical protein